MRSSTRWKARDRSDALFPAESVYAFMLRKSAKRFTAFSQSVGACDGRIGNFTVSFWTGIEPRASCCRCKGSKGRQHRKPDEDRVRSKEGKATFGRRGG